MNAQPPIDDRIPEHRPVSAAERLATIYRSPGPYVTIYIATRPPAGDGDDRSLEDRWRSLQDKLGAGDVPQHVLQAIDARLGLAAPDDSAAIAIIAAADGTTVVEHGSEPPRADLALHDTLPYAAPMLEWQQRRIPHLVMVVDASGCDIVSFRSDHLATVDTYDLSGAELTETAAAHVAAIDAQLVVVSFADQVETDLVEELRATVPITCHVVDERSEADRLELADTTVREVSDLVARRTVGRLRELRFLTTHDGAVDGTDDTIAALADGSAARLLLHDDPRDKRRIWIGGDPNQLSRRQRPGYVEARLVDAAIRSAILQQIPVNIIPTTGTNGPAENTAAVLKNTDDQLPI